LFGSYFVASRWSFPRWCLCFVLPILLFKYHTLLFELPTLMFVFRASHFVV
jgi:hypothetical protein